MSVMSLSEPTTTDVEEAEEIHYYCCREDLALCGISLEDSYLEEDGDKICTLCEIALHEVGVDVVCIGGCAFVRL